MKKVLIITTSLRHGSNSDALAEAFARGAAEAGNQVETISLKGKDIRFCKGCLREFLVCTNLRPYKLRHRYRETYLADIFLFRFALLCKSPQKSRIAQMRTALAVMLILPVRISSYANTITTSVVAVNKINAGTYLQIQIEAGIVPNEPPPFA